MSGVLISCETKMLKIDNIFENKRNANCAVLNRTNIILCCHDYRNGFHKHVGVFPWTKITYIGYSYSLNSPSTSVIVYRSVDTKR